MAQAERITTAIRELMSRGRPPTSTNPVRAAHTEFLAALASNAPHSIRSDGDSEPIEGFGSHPELDDQSPALPPRRVHWHR